MLKKPTVYKEHTLFKKYFSDEMKYVLQTSVQCIYQHNIYFNLYSPKKPLKLPCQQRAGYTAHKRESLKRIY